MACCGVAANHAPTVWWRPSEVEEERVRLVLCMGVDCNEGGRARPLQKCLKAWLAEHPERNVRLEIASCLTHCAQGPNLVRYPGGCVSHRLDISKLESLLREMSRERRESPVGD